MIADIIKQLNVVLRNGSTILIFRTFVLSRTLTAVRPTPEPVSPLGWTGREASQTQLRTLFFLSIPSPSYSCLPRYYPSGVLQ